MSQSKKTVAALCASKGLWKDATMELVPCPVCGTDESKSLFSRPDGLSVVQCSECGQTFINPRPSQQDLMALYERDYYTGQDTIGYVDYIERSVRQTRRVLQAETVESNRWVEVLQYFENHRETEGHRLLDVGCATGSFVALSRKLEWDATGIDVSHDTVQVGKAEFDLPLICGTIECLRPRAQPFDAVTAFDLIEHLVDPVDFLAHVNRLMHAQGLLCLSTPNARCGELKGKGKASHIYRRCFEHMVYFDDDTITACMEKAGFRVLDIQAKASTGMEWALRRSRSLELMRRTLSHFRPVYLFARHSWRSVNRALNAPAEKKGLGDTLTVFARKVSGCE